MAFTPSSAEPQSSAPANHNNRTRQAQCRRRMATLEKLEDRTLLSSVTTPFGFVSGTLTITADRFNNQFSIAEVKDPNGGGHHVTITALDKATNINGIAFSNGVFPSWTSPRRGQLHHCQ